MERPERLDTQSADGAQLNLDALYQIAPSCFTEATDPKSGKIKRLVNFDVLRQLLGDDAVEDATEAYEFNWVGKQEARAEVLRPIYKTLRPVKEDSVDWDNTQNLYIEGDNLEVLKLLQKSYLGKVKMIYIDPPYNTGNDFVYHDDFARTQTEEDLFAGNVDELGNRFRRNPDSNGKYHSDWCSMIYSRLMVARSLLKDNGVLFISIGEHEVRNLRNICDEVFGEHNFISTISWVSKSGGSGDEKYIISATEYIIVYAKNIDNVELGKEPVDTKDEKYNLSDSHVKERGKYVLKKLDFRMTSLHYTESLNYPVIDPDGNELWPGGESYRQNGGWNWRWSKQKVEWGLKNDFLEFKNNRGKWTLNSKQYQNVDNNNNPIDRRIAYKNFILSSEFNTTQGSRLVVDFFGSKIFEYAKPVGLIEKLLLISNATDKDIILDFFSGSCTTAHSVMQLNAEDGGNRKFIMVQLPEKTPEDSEAFIAGYKNICEIGKERIRRAGKKIKEEHPEAKDLDTGFRVFRIDESNFENVERTPKDYNQDELDLFLNNIKSDRSDLDLLFGCMLDWGVQLSLPMNSEEVDGKMIYTVNDGDLVACFADKVTDKVVKAMADKQPLRVIFRDSCFDQDADKINIYETFKQLLDWSDKDVEKNIRVI